VYGKAMTNSKRQAQQNVVEMVMKPQTAKLGLDTEQKEAVAKVG
jgi:hypothetical protein